MRSALAAHPALFYAAIGMLAGISIIGFAPDPGALAYGVTLTTLATAGWVIVDLLGVPGPHPLRDSVGGSGGAGAAGIAFAFFAPRGPWPFHVGLMVAGAALSTLAFTVGLSWWRARHNDTTHAAS